MRIAAGQEHACLVIHLFKRGLGEACSNVRGHTIGWLQRVLLRLNVRATVQGAACRETYTGHQPPNAEGLEFGLYWDYVRGLQRYLRYGCVVFWARTNYVGRCVVAPRGRYTTDSKLEVSGLHQLAA